MANRIERYIGRDGVAVELRYQDDLNGVESLDELVCEGVHIEMLGEGVCWGDFHGVHATWGANKRGSLRFQATPDDIREELKP